MTGKYIFAGDAANFDYGVLPFKIQAVVTSPPYYYKRRYPIADSWFGGNPDCEHKNIRLTKPARQRSANDAPNDAQKFNNEKRCFDAPSGAVCEDCGAWRGQLGLEPTPDMFVSHLADIFARIPLADDGVIWCNIGDSYVGGPPNDIAPKDKQKAGGSSLKEQKDKFNKDLDSMRASQLKQKDLIGVPYRLAFEMQRRGFYWRDNIVWCKSQAMPESVRDRTHNQTEAILMFTKNRQYKFNIDAVKVLKEDPSCRRYDTPIRKMSFRTVQTKQAGVISEQHSRLLGQRNTHRALRNVWEINPATHWRKAHRDGEIHLAPMPTEIPRRCILLTTDEGDAVLDPFSGTGTVCAMAQTLNRIPVGVDLDSRGVEFAEKTTKHFDGGLLS